MLVCSFNNANNFSFFKPRKIKVISSKPYKFPPYIESITFGNDFNHISDSQNLPENLNFLQCGDFFNQSISSLPPKLTTLILGKRFSKNISSLPSSLTFLDLGQTFNHPLTFLPPSLIHLKISEKFSHSLSLQLHIYLSGMKI